MLASMSVSHLAINDAMQHVRGGSVDGSPGTDSRAVSVRGDAVTGEPSL